jgi:hypothetical protein
LRQLVVSVVVDSSTKHVSKLVASDDQKIILSVNFEEDPHPDMVAFFKRSIWEYWGFDER